MTTTVVHAVLDLDSDGFLRRRCEACEREFKWLQTPAGEAPAYDVDCHYCPYCGVAGDDFWTPAQVEYLKAIAVEDAMGPILRELETSAERLNRSGGFLRMSVKRSGGSPPRRPEAREDMRFVDFPCHPKEPVKILGEWVGPLHCLTCGRRSE